MKSYTKLRNLYGDITNDDSSTNLTRGDQFINDSIRKFISSVKGDYLYDTQTIAMVADTQFYNLANDFNKLRGITKTIGSTNYTPQEVSSMKAWNIMNDSSYSSSIPEYFFIRNNQIGFLPIPSDTNNVTVYYEKKIIELSNADYTTGTITTATNGSTAIVGDSTVWTASMAGRYIQIDSGAWYKIASVTDNTHLVLDRNFQELSISAGSATYIIGEMPIIPEDYHIAPVYYAVAQYWQMNEKPVRAREYERMFNEIIKTAKADINTQVTSPVIDNEAFTMDNPNNYITLT